MENKRELSIRTNKIGHYEICYIGGGEVPSKLRGAWNRKVIAQQAIDHHLYLQKLEDDKQAAKEAAKVQQAKENLAAIKAKSKSKSKAAKAKAESVDGKGQAGV